MYLNRVYHFVRYVIVYLCWWSSFKIYTWSVNYLTFSFDFLNEINGFLFILLFCWAGIYFRSHFVKEKILTPDWKFC